MRQNPRQQSFHDFNKKLNLIIVCAYLFFMTKAQCSECQVLFTMRDLSSVLLEPMSLNLINLKLRLICSSWDSFKMKSRKPVVTVQKLNVARKKKTRSVSTRPQDWTWMSIRSSQPWYAAQYDVMKTSCRYQRSGPEPLWTWQYTTPFWLHDSWFFITCFSDAPINLLLLASHISLRSHPQGSRKQERAFSGFQNKITAHTHMGTSTPHVRPLQCTWGPRVTR